MKASIQTKLLLMCVGLVVVITSGISLTYYMLTKQDKQRESQQRIQVAFDIIIDDLTRQVQNDVRRFDDFLQQDSSLRWFAYFYANHQQELNSLSFLYSSLVKTTNEMKNFGKLAETDRLLLYGSNKRLLAAYQRKDGAESIGGYVIAASGQDAYLALDDFTKITKMIDESQPIPDNPLPAEFAALYAGDFPEQIITQPFHENQRFGMRIIAPIRREEGAFGVIVGEFFYRQREFERYALLSNTDVNLFAGQQFSLGTLTAENQLDAARVASRPACATLQPGATKIGIDLVKLADQPYYQGACIFQNHVGEMVGAMTVNLSQQFERQAIQKTLSAILAVAAIVSLFAIGATIIGSRKTLRFFQEVSTVIQRLAIGDLPEKIVPRNNGEFYVIAQNLNALIASMHSVTDLAQEIAAGNFSVTVQARSPQDALMHALQTMVANLRDVARVAQEIAAGNLAVELVIRSERDELMCALNTMVTNLREVAHVAQEIAAGNLAVKVHIRSDRDALMQTLHTMILNLQEVARLAESIAAGNLTMELTERSTQDSLIQALNRMVRHIQQIVQQVQSAADYVAAGSGELRVSAHGMAQGASVQAASSEELSSSMEQMAANIRQNADNASQTEKIAMQSAQYAEETGKVVAETVIAMQQIVKKIDIIQDIANQTRMLSLNATIEAARAQEYGRSFSVVAAEVRKLAEITKSASEEISELADSSRTVAEHAGAMLAQLIPNIHKTANLVQEISAATNEQSSGAEQINKALQQLDVVTQQNVTTSEHLSSAAEELAAQAEQLQNAMTFFNIAGHSTMIAPALPAERSLSAAPGMSALSKRGERPRTQQPARQDVSLYPIEPMLHSRQLHDVAEAQDPDFERF